MELKRREELILDAREPVAWEERVLDKLREAQLTYCREPDKVIITTEQLDDAKRRLRMGTPVSDSGRSIWGLPLEVVDS